MVETPDNRTKKPSKGQSKGAVQISGAREKVSDDIDPVLGTDSLSRGERLGICGCFQQNMLVHFQS